MNDIDLLYMIHTDLGYIVAILLFFLVGAILYLIFKIFDWFFHF